MFEWFPGQGRGSGLIALPPVLAVAVLLLACGGSPYKPSSDDAPTIYMEACLPCHQGGSAGPSLAGRALTPETVRQRLDRGGRGMPSFPGITGETRARLVEYVVRLSSPESSKPR